jgi:hypothetical protein
MSISASSLAEAAVADWTKPDARKIAPKRVITAVRDASLTPEAR